MRRFNQLLGIVTLFLAGCASISEHYQNRPFFLAEEDIATHGRKSWFDRGNPNRSLSQTIEVLAVWTLAI